MSSPLSWYMLNWVANRLQFTHPADTEHHLESCFHPPEVQYSLSGNMWLLGAKCSNVFAIYLVTVCESAVYWWAGAGFEGLQTLDWTCWDSTLLCFVVNSTLKWEMKQSLPILLNRMKNLNRWVWTEHIKTWEEGHSEMQANENPLAVTSGDSCVLPSSGSEICLRVIKVCSTSVLLFCLLWISTSLSLCGTQTYTQPISTAAASAVVLLCWGDFSYCIVGRCHCVVLLSWLTKKVLPRLSCRSSQPGGRAGSSWLCLGPDMSWASRNSQPGCES